LLSYFSVVEKRAMSKITLILKSVAGFLLYCGICHGVSAKPLPFRELDLPGAGSSQQHHLEQTAGGELIASWVETDGGNSTAKFAILEKLGWSMPLTVVKVEGKLADPPVVQGLSDGSLDALCCEFRGPLRGRDLPG
jgi:hypothetical protein